MNKIFKFTILGFSAILSASMVSCSDKDDNPDNPNDKDYVTTTVGFKDAPSQYFGGPTSYGANLYAGAENQITTGYLAKVYSDTYAQFSINYGYNYNADFVLDWCYTFYNGGLALSNYHDMTEATYLNQLSVYSNYSPSGDNFVVANGSSAVTNPGNAKYSDYEGCAHVYLTDASGYSVKNNILSGEDEEGFFKSLYINNTTYTYLTMKEGNDYCAPLNEKNEGWFKVQFIAFEDDDANQKPVGYTEMYLANFKKDQADGYIGIIDEWTKVDLSMLPEASILVINFVGSDMGDYGLNTPAYCALDSFEIAVEKD